MKMRTVLAAVAAATAAFASAAGAQVLPNGWAIHPAGALTALGTLPLHMVIDPAGRWIAVVNAGFGDLAVSVIDAATGRIVDSKPLDNAFFGIAFSPDGRTLYVATAAQSGVHRYDFDPGTGKLHDDGAWTIAKGDVWTAGLAVSPNGDTVFAVGQLSDTLYAIDAHTGAAMWSTKTGSQPLAVALLPDGTRAYVSDWGASSITVVDVHTRSVINSIHVGRHPNALLFSRDGRTLFVACADRSTVDAVDVATERVRTSVEAGIWKRSIEGTTPDGLALSADGHTLFVADAGDDAITAVDVATGALIGAIPVGWYPTDVTVSPDGASIYVLDGNGISGHPNPSFGHSDVSRNPPHQELYIGDLMTGDLERENVPGVDALHAGLATVRDDAAYRGGAAAAPARSATIRHIIYVIKENRTYDEVLGDDRRGNGDASLAIFGRRITPNIHRLADDFVLLDGFEENGFVSADGHNWADAAYADDYVEKLWPANYAGRNHPYDFEGDKPSVPDAGYLWDDAIAHGRSVRDYGEFVLPVLAGQAVATPSLRGHVDLRYRGWDLTYSDQSRMDEWTREFDAFDRNGDLPDLEVVYLPDDHTAATRPGYRTPFAMLASNDYAVGRLVARLSRSRYWKDTVVFVVEDDSQAGPDHVSAQRAEALMVGGPVRRGVVAHDRFTQASVLHTIEWALGLPPMSQFDAGAPLMTRLLADTPDLAPWTASKPNLKLGDRNSSRTAQADASSRLDLSEADAADASEVNRILYAYAHTHAAR